MEAFRKDILPRLQFAGPDNFGEITDARGIW